MSISVKCIEWQRAAGIDGSPSRGWLGELSSAAFSIENQSFCCPGDKSCLSKGKKNKKKLYTPLNCYPRQNLFFYLPQIQSPGKTPRTILHSSGIQLQTRWNQRFGDRPEFFKLSPGKCKNGGEKYRGLSWRRVQAEDIVPGLNARCEGIIHEILSSSELRVSVGLGRGLQRLPAR